MLIRHADPDRDGAACAAIYAPFVTASAVSFEEAPPSSEEFARRIARVSERYPYLVADDDGRVAGFAYASQHRERAAYRWAADVTIYLGERHRGRGLGRMLYATLLDLLARQGIRTAIGGITLPNPASVALHEACGFTLVGVYRNIGYKEGGWRDVGWWQLELPRADLEPQRDPPAEPGPPVRLESLG